MANKQRQSVSEALRRLRIAVLAGCWLAGAALAAQMLIWSLAMFTDARVERLEQSRDAQQAEAPLIVESATRPAVAMPSFMTQQEPEAVDVNVTMSRWDRLFAVASKLTRGAGILAVLVLVPFVAVGVLLAAGSATPGVEKTVSAFCWAVLVGTLILPLGNVIGLPWSDGALVSYEPMMTQIDRVRGAAEAPEAADAQTRDGRFILYARYLALPAACITGLFLIGLNFSGGVEMAIISAREEMRLDPELEKECADRTPTSLVGGRAGSALKATMDAEPDLGPSGSPIPNAAPQSMPQPMPDLPRATEISPGQVPKRLI